MKTRARQASPANKYHAIKVTFDGITFDSKKEGYHYLRLKLLQQEGKISNLRLQVPYELLPAIYEDEVIHLKTKDKVVRKLVQRPVTYVADFVYTQDGHDVVVDTKGLRLGDYIIKKKMMRAILGINIVEI